MWHSLQVLWCIKRKVFQYYIRVCYSRIKGGGMANITIRVFPKSNCLYLKLEGFLTVNEAKDLKKRYGMALQKCRRGFTVFSDISDLRTQTPQVQEIMGKITKMTGDAGVSRVARVVGSNPIAGIQLGRLAKSESDFPAGNFKTAEEAIRFLSLQ